MNTVTKNLMLGLLFGVIGCGSLSADVTLGPLAEKGPEDVPTLIRALEDPAMGTRWNAALVLGEIGDDSAVAALVECVRQDDSVRVRCRAIEALTKIGSVEAVPVLIAALASDYPLERRDAARALGALGDPAAVPVLIEALNDVEGFVRRDAARALGRVGDAEAVPALQELSGETGPQYSPERPLGPGEESPAARAALLALLEIGGDTMLPALRELLGSDLVYVRAHAITTAGDMGPRAAKAAPLIAEYLADDEVPEVARYGVHAGRLGPIVRRAAIEALREIGGSEGVAGLAETFNRIAPPWNTLTDIQDLQSAMDAMTELGDPAVLPVLRVALEMAENEENTGELHPRNRARLVTSIRQNISAFEK